MKLFLVVCAAMCAVHIVCLGFTRDTLANFDPHTASAFYRDNRIASQAARFDLAAPAYVRKVTLWLAGKGTGHVSVRLYGNEGAFSAPLLDHPLSTTLDVQKTNPGVQKVEVALPADLFIDQPQFFVVVEKLDPGIRLLSDRTPKERICRTPTESWGYQAVRGEDGAWRAGRYGFAISAVVDYPDAAAPAYLALVTEGVGLVTEAASNRSIAWGDIDNDGWIDLLAGGQFYLNRDGKEFRNESERIENLGTVKAHHVADIDNDRDLDVFLLGDVDSSSYLLINDGHGYFTSRRLDIPPISSPRTVAFADVDDDNDIDLFIGQGADSLGDLLPGILLLNSGRGGFALPPRDREFSSEVFVGVIGAQWIDIDGDGDQDLSITRDDAQKNDLLVNDGTGLLTSRSSIDHASAATIAMATRDAQHGRSGTGDWADFDGDGEADQILPISLKVGDVALHRIDDVISLPTIPYQGWGGGGTWSDVNNDGRFDALITSLCDCRYASLYTGTSADAFIDESFAYGLFRVPAGTDAVWADYDNDGLLDLATFVGDHLHLFRNTGEFDNNFIALDLSGSTSPGGSVGATVTLFVDGTSRVQTVKSGRGALMQGPTRIHFGLDDAQKIDSIIVVSAGDEMSRIVMRDPEINRIHHVYDKSRTITASTNAASVTAAPNPFTTALTFTCTLPEKSPVRLTIHGLDGALLAVVIDEAMESGDQSISWSARDAEGQQLPPGTYIWRAVIGSTQATGRALLVR